MKAMILAAGRGERMRPLTDHMPKPMLKVQGRPMIEWIIEGLVRAGVSELVVNHAHLGMQIEGTLGDGTTLGASIRYSAEREALETAGGIARALTLLGDAPFIAVNGDLLSDYDFSRLVRHALDQDLAHLVMVPNPAHHPMGDFALNGTRLASHGESACMHTFAGIGLYQPRLFKDIASGQRAQLAPLLRAAMNAHRVSGEMHAGIWHDVGTPERLAALNADMP